MKQALRLIEQQKKQKQQEEEDEEGGGISMGSSMGSSMFGKKPAPQQLKRGNSMNKMQEEEGGIPSSSMKGFGTKNAMDAMSRKSTAMSSDQGTPGSFKPPRVASGKQARADSAKRQGSAKELQRNNTQRSIAAAAEKEAMILSLDGGKKKKKPGHLKPLPQLSANQKFAGNFAADVLADLEQNSLNKKRTSDMKKLDREINGYLKFNTTELAAQMNNAFEGNQGRVALEEKMIKGDKEKDKRVKAILAMAGKQAAELDPILEEGASGTGQDVAIYNPGMSLSEQRKLKNEELKRKVAQITNKEKGKSNKDVSDTESQISSASSKDSEFFITKTKSKTKGKAKYQNKEDSPTARAAKALAIMNDEPDEQLEVVRPLNEEVVRYLTPAQEVENEVLKHEREMNQMFLELNDLEDMIKGNKDLKQMEDLMGVTNETIEFHKTTFNTLKDSVLSINQQAETAVESLNFYGADEDEEAKETKKPKKDSNKLENQLLRIEEEGRNDGEDDESGEIQRGGKVSHEAEKVKMFNKIEDMHSNMKSYAGDIESRLNNLYKNGAGAKFGFDDVAQNANKKISLQMSEDEKKINKIEQQAAKYLKQNSISQSSISSDGSKAMKPKMLKSKNEEKKK